MVNRIVCDASRAHPGGGVSPRARHEDSRPLSLVNGAITGPHVHAREPLVKKIDSNLWELQEESGTNTYHIAYFFFTGRRIIFLHGFQKQSQKTPRRELEEARRYYRDFLAQSREE